MLGADHAAGAALRSPALVADGRHLLADVVTSVGVVAGILLALALDMPVLDPALAALVAVNILWSGWRVIRGVARRPDGRGGAGSGRSPASAR